MKMKCTIHRLSGTSSTLSSVFTLLLVITFGIFGNISFVTSLPAIVRMGAIFESNQLEQEIVFRYAIEKVNENPSILPNVTLVPYVERVSTSDSLISEGKLCNLLYTGVACVLGPINEISSMHIRSIVDTLEIPHLEVHYDVLESIKTTGLTINVYPRPESLARATLDLLRILGWEDFAIVYDYNEQVILYSSLLQEARDKGWSVKLYQLSPLNPFRDTWYQVQEDKKVNIILDAKIHNLAAALKQAQQVGLMTSEVTYIVNNLDFVTLPLEDFLYSGAKIFYFRIVDDMNRETINLLNIWPNISDTSGLNVTEAPSFIKTESGLIYDSVHLFALSLGELNKSQSIEPRPVSCQNEIPWIHGTSVINYLRPIVFKGMTGVVTLTQYGQRSDFNLNLFTLDASGSINVGSWNSRLGVNITADWLEAYSNYAIQQRPLIVTTVETQPYTMKTIASFATKGNSQFEGYAVDLIDELSQLLNFKYEIRLCKDGKYGAQGPDGSWNGMIGELLRNEADLAIVDLTITRKREQVVDFTLPFMTTGVSILYLKPQKAESDFFGFLAPFSNTVWILLLLALAMTSLFSFICGRLSPYEWQDPSPCYIARNIVTNDLSMKNAFWLKTGSLMQQGCDIMPKAMSTRLICIVWYFFIMILVASYTANLAAFLTVEIVDYPFKDYVELSQQKKIGYGCGASGSTRVSFRDSTDGYLKKISDFMEASPSMFVANNEEGIQRVLKGNYAFFMEAAAIEYAVERECNLTQVGGLLDNKGYGIALRKYSPIRQALSRGILKLQEQGKLHTLYERWWKQKRGGGSCQTSGGSGAEPMSLDNVGGVFVVLVVGGVFSFFVALFEFVYKHKQAAPNSITMWENIKADLAFFFRLHEYTKPNRYKGMKPTKSSHPLFYKCVSDATSRPALTN